jgi:hypothetical protein
MIKSEPIIYDKPTTRPVPPSREKNETRVDPSLPFLTQLEARTIVKRTQDESSPEERTIKRARASHPARDRGLTLVKRRTRPRNSSLERERSERVGKVDRRVFGHDGTNALDPFG